MGVGAADLECSLNAVKKNGPGRRLQGGAGQFSFFFFPFFGGVGSWFADSALARRRNERLSVLFLSPINQTGTIVAAHVPLAQCCCD